LRREGEREREWTMTGEKDIEKTSKEEACQSDIGDSDQEL
jgi:hypothetical protein